MPQTWLNYQVLWAISFYDKNDSRSLSSRDISANFYSKAYLRGCYYHTATTVSMTRLSALAANRIKSCLQMNSIPENCSRVFKLIGKNRKSTKTYWRHAKRW